MRVCVALFLCLVLPGLPAAGAAEPPPAATATGEESAVRLAGTAARAVERDEAAWRDLTDRLARAVEAYRPGLSADPLPEDEALQAFRRYVTKLLESGREVAALCARRADARAALADSLRKSPAYYRAAARSLRERAESARFETVKEKYRLAADVWEQLAVRAEARAKELGIDDAAAGVAALIAEENRFLDDFLKTLDALPRPAGPERGRAEELLAALRRHAARGDELQKQLRAFRDKLRAAPPPAEAVVPAGGSRPTEQAAAPGSRRRPEPAPGTGDRR